VTPVSVDLSTFVTNDGTFIYALQKEDVGDFKYMAASLKRKFKVSPREIKRFNPSAEWYTGGIKVGLKLRLPNKGCQACGYGGGQNTSSNNPESSPSASAPNGATHTVVKGDTAYALMRKYGISVADLKRINPKVNFDALPLGTVLLVSVNGKKTGTCPMCGGLPPAGKVQAISQVVKTPLMGFLGAFGLTTRGVQSAGSGAASVVNFVVRMIRQIPGIVQKLPK